MLAHELRNPVAAVSSALQAMNGAESPERLRLTGILTRQVGHPVRLKQVLGNLLDNAAKYTSPGGAITLRVDIEDGEAVVRVRDTGIGIASEFLPQVFDVFSRVGSHATQSRPGLGLGLAVVRDLVMQHGGTVAVSSPGPGRGAEFVIRLPLLDENEGAVAPVSAKPTRSDPVLSVLLVEDNDDAREALRILLELKGQRVLTARDGREAVEEVQAQSPDVALIDIGLPDVDGFEVA